MVIFPIYLSTGLPPSFCCWKRQKWATSWQMQSITNSEIVCKIGKLHQCCFDTGVMARASVGILSNSHVVHDHTLLLTFFW